MIQRYEINKFSHRVSKDDEGDWMKSQDVSNLASELMVLVAQVGGSDPMSIEILMEIGRKLQDFRI